ncbi:AraD1 family protein [Caenimonas soli]|uniref:AraD1 family protein n=1 Tax=Caenimonas soli TaxID=2735555 RepID=UPI001F21A28E|nr:AraD1 family protein [Caenimonas soli]
MAALRLLQFLRPDGSRAVGLVESAARVRVLAGCDSTYALASQALAERVPLAHLAKKLASAERVDYGELVERQAVLVPLDHPDPAHMLVSSSGLTHLGSERTRDHLRRALQVDDASLSDSLRLFKLGLEQGRPTGNGTPGVAPEWHFKGTGRSVVHPYQDFPVASFAEDASEEPELAGLYLIGADGMPRRLGFALANELSDHITERSNSGLVSHAKLCGSSFGPELLLDDLPASIAGVSRIVRKGRKRWEKPFLTGEDHMSHSIGNIEFHHFKYDQFLVPGDVHVHYFGTATLSFSEGIKVDASCRFEISAPPFGHPLINGIRRVENAYRYGSMQAA